MYQSRPCVVLPTFTSLMRLDGRGQLSEIAERVLIGGEIEIVAGLVAQHRFGRRRLRERDDAATSVAAI